MDIDNRKKYLICKVGVGIGNFLFGLCKVILN